MARRIAMGAFSMLARVLAAGGRVAGSPLDALKTARVPAHRLLGGTYRAGAFPVPLGPGRCAKKGHRPLPRRRILEDVGQSCTRCQSGWQFPDPPAPKPSGPGMKARA